MLESISITIIVELASMFTVLGGAWHTVNKIKKDHQHDREKHKQEILKAAFDADEKLSKAVETRIEILLREREAKFEGLRKDLDSCVSALETEIDHIKEKQAGEIRVLGEKIEDLRSELRTQHGQLINMITKLIDKT